MGGGTFVPPSPDWLKDRIPLYNNFCNFVIIVDYWQQLARGEKSDTIIKGPRNRPFLKEKTKSDDPNESEKNEENHPYHTNEKSKLILQYQNRQVTYTDFL